MKIRSHLIIEKCLTFIIQSKNLIKLSLPWRIWDVCSFVKRVWKGWLINEV